MVMMKFKSRYGLLLLSLVGFLFFSASAALAENPQEETFKLAVAKVISIDDLGYDEFKAAHGQLLNLEIISGDYKGRDMISHNYVPDNLAYAIKAKTGKKYLVAIDNDTDEVSITDHYRQDSIVYLVLSFFLLLIILGGFQGFKAIISLLLSGLAIFYFLIPAIQNSFNPIFAAIIVAAFSTAVTMLLIAGWTKKSLAATVGTTGGVAIAGLIALFVIEQAPLSGLASSEARILLGNLMFQNQDSPIAILDFRGILAAGVLISSLGAAMDVAISIASSTHELYLANPRQTYSELFKHAITIGKDIMGTMTNTLILAYTGSAIPLFLLLANSSGIKILNMEIIATEITAATVGSIGLIAAIPITAMLSALLYKMPQKS